jgi:hypothetical protein
MKLLILLLAIFAGLRQWGVVVHSPGETAPPVSREPDSRPSMGGWSGWICSAIPSKCATSPKSGSSFLSPSTLGDRMSIAFGRSGRAIRSESTGDSSIANDLSWTVFFGMIVNRFTIDVA